MNYLKIGIDVGGTNTDAVLLDQNNRLLAALKSPTTADVATGIWSAVDGVLQQAGVDPGAIRHVMVGTTACTNALIERKGLARTAVLRLGAPATTSVEPLFAWDDDLRAAIGGGRGYLLKGGFEYDGRLIDTEPDPAEIDRVIQELQAEEIEAVAISCVFSPVRADHEKQVAAQIAAALGPGVPISLSHEIGSIGLLERENSAVLNATLARVADRFTRGVEQGLQQRGITADVFFSQNDGTLMALGYARRYPILTIGSGPTNSIRGAAFLTGLSDCVVVDIGGTSTDVGVLVRGFPRQSAIAVEIGGVQTNFRMPDLVSVGLGGGSVVRHGAGALRIGPDSVGYRLVSEALAWGGDTLTTTDIVVAAGSAAIADERCDPARVAHLAPELIAAVQAEMRRIIETCIDRVRTSQAAVPVVLVGGGSILAPDHLTGAAALIRPDNYMYANAIGAAIAQVSGEVDRMWALEGISRAEAVEQARQEAIQEAIRAGADPETVGIVDVEDTPLAYLPGVAVRIRAKAAGTLRTGVWQESRS